MNLCRDSSGRGCEGESGGSGSYGRSSGSISPLRWRARRPRTEVTAPRQAKALAMEAPITPVPPTIAQCLPAREAAMPGSLGVGAGRGTLNFCEKAGMLGGWRWKLVSFEVSFFAMGISLVLWLRGNLKNVVMR